MNLEPQTIVSMHAVGGNLESYVDLILPIPDCLTTVFLHENSNSIETWRTCQTYVEPPLICNVYVFS